MTRILHITQDTPGLSEQEASEVFEHMERFASYGFNKSHAAAYAAISFQTAYLKRHHPEAFFAASMNLAIGNVKDIAVFVGQMKARGIPILPPSINLCDARFKPIRGRTRIGVAYGLGALRGISMAAAEAVVAERTQNGRFTSFADLQNRVRTIVGKKGLLALVQSGACDAITTTRAAAAAMAEEKTTHTYTHQISLFDTCPNATTPNTLNEWTTEEKLDREFDTLGFWLSGHPLDGFLHSNGPKPVTLVGALRRHTHTPRQALIAASVIDWDTKGTKSGGVMAILTLSDPFETFEAMAFDNNWFAIRDHIKKKATLTFAVSPMEEDGDLRLIIQGIAGQPTIKRKTA